MFSVSVNLEKYNSFFEEKSSFGTSRNYLGLRWATWKCTIMCQHAKVGKKGEEKYNFLHDILSVLIILQVRIKFVFTFYFLNFLSV